MAKRRCDRFRTVPAAVFGLAVLIVVSVGVMAEPARAQTSNEVHETCARYNVAIQTGGPVAASAAGALRDLGAPNPPGVAEALDVLIDAESDTPPSGTRPDEAQLNEALATLQGYFGPICDGLDICPLIRQAIATDDASSAEAARLARGLATPAPPGIDAALALIAGEITIDESPFHDSVAEAQAQVGSYFPCELAFTGTATAPLLLAGAALVAAGSLVMRTARRIEHPHSA